MVLFFLKHFCFILNVGWCNIIHLYKYLIYCGDKIAKYEFYNKSYNKNKFKFSKYKIITFLRIFTNEQLINILI